MRSPDLESLLLAADAVKGHSIGGLYDRPVGRKGRGTDLVHHYQVFNTTLIFKAIALDASRTDLWVNTNGRQTLFKGILYHTSF